MKTLMRKGIQLCVAVGIIAGIGLIFQSNNTGVMAALDAKQQACEGLNATGATNCGADSGASVDSLVETIINILSVVVGAISVIMIIIGGFRYVISNGESNSVQGAKNTILYAIVGLVIVLFAQVIVAFVIDRSIPAPSGTNNQTGTGQP